ncbi:hypothetical protein [Marinimicrococcus flavescens]|uniref:Uncharacterized protein n=1 Tax=Marinimicrococcus flavescens TaxID=3031815 RepID=A0AAP3V274_9PROT|nr:hypothetical protein [Marinimicrococcus flavescens]
MRRCLCASFLAAALLALPTGAALGQAVTPDWPCVQRLVPELALGQVWSGPPASGHGWQTDPETASLALELARRKMPLDAAGEAIASFAAGVPADQRAARLADLAKGVLELINGARADMIRGIRRYAQRQQALATRIAEESHGLKGLPPGRGSEVPPELAERKEQRDWDLRVYEDRQALLRQLCEEPVLLEQRAFALGRMMAANLP